MPRLSKRFVFTLGLLDAVILSVVVAVLVTGFFPGFYSSLYDVPEKLAGLIAAIMILGPVMSLVVYKDDQVEYANDLCVVYLVKLCVIAVALHIAYTHRPILTVFAVDRFVVVQAKQTRLEYMPPGIMTRMLQSEHPPLIAARQLPKEELYLLLEVMGGGLDIEYRPSQYENFDYHTENFRQRFCNPDVEFPFGESEAVSGCTIVKVPLIYSRDEAAIAVFDYQRQLITNVLFQKPW